MVIEFGTLFAIFYVDTMNGPDGSKEKEDRMKEEKRNEIDPNKRVIEQLAKAGIRREIPSDQQIAEAKGLNDRLFLVGTEITVACCSDAMADAKNIGRTGTISEIVVEPEEGFDALYVVRFTDERGAPHDDEATCFHGELKIRKQSAGRTYEEIVADAMTLEEEHAINETDER